MLKDALPDQEIKAPKPPAKPKNISPEEANAMLKQGEARFLDVRSEHERTIAQVPGFEMLDQALLQDLLDNESRERSLVVMCHFGGRSAQASAFLAEQGFQDVNNVVGGIDAWAQNVDTDLARY